MIVRFSCGYQSKKDAEAGRFGVLDVSFNSSNVSSLTDDVKNSSAKVCHANRKGGRGRGHLTQGRGDKSGRGVRVGKVQAETKEQKSGRRTSSKIEVEESETESSEEDNEKSDDSLSPKSKKKKC